MANFNKVILLGNLTRDPQLRYLPSQTPVVDFGLAVNRRFKTQSGEQRDETTFVDCSAFGRTAEIINQYCRKGKQVAIDGRLQQRSWEDKEGKKQSSVDVVVENLQMLGAPGDSGGGSGGGYQGSSGGSGGGSSGGSAPADPYADSGAGFGPDAPDDDDIPF
jgi:single-strand DNA-binding protein